MWGRGRSKYHNRKVKFAGMEFDSKIEADEFLLLSSLQKKGKIHSLQRQVKIRLSDKPPKGYGKQRHYIADFVFFDCEKNSWVVWDSKGMRIEPYQTKRDWLLDKFCGFIFVESTREAKKEFKAYGAIEIEFDLPKESK